MYFILALRAIELPEMCAVKNGISFLSHFISQSRNYPNMTSTVLERGLDIVQRTINCIGIITPRSQVDIFAEIFIALNKKYPAELVTWMKILESDGFPTHAVTEADRLQFMKLIIRYK